jgi:hypothetical protein
MRSKLQNFFSTIIQSYFNVPVPQKPIQYSQIRVDSTQAMSNIFLLPASLDKKQRFAAFWEYLLENIPSIGQEFVDFLVQRSGKSGSRLIRAVSYPSIANVQPDLLLECQDFDIICDHRLDSEMVRHSLEAFLSSARSRSKLTYVAIISNSYCLIEQELLERPETRQNYLMPIDGINLSMPYFCWQDIYAIVAQSCDRLAYEFAEYMHFMDMQPWQHSTWAELFINPNVAKEFSKEWLPTISYFQDLGVNIKLTGYSALEITYPLPWLQLLYVYTARSVSHNDLQSVSPYLVATVWLKGSELEKARAFHGIVDQFVVAKHPAIEVDVRASVADGLWTIKSGNRPKLAATYYTSLDRVVSSDRDQMQDNLLAFTKAVFDHAQSI